VTDQYAQTDALIRFYLGIDPDTMSDETWATSGEQILWVLKFTGVIKDK
jgi:hypothetical protein